MFEESDIVLSPVEAVAARFTIRLPPCFFRAYVRRRAVGEYSSIVCAIAACSRVLVILKRVECNAASIETIDESTLELTLRVRDGAVPRSVDPRTSPADRREFLARGIHGREELHVRESAEHLEIREQFRHAPAARVSPRHNVWATLQLLDPVVNVVARIEVA
jgi:hypothetical protein